MTNRIHFYKYHGTGNDFILVDARSHSGLQLPVKELCQRRFGIGADGLMLLTAVAGYDFGMVYYNSDGKESSMCGNGGRCIVKFAADLGIISDRAHFVAIDGPHTARIFPDGTVELGMKDVDMISTLPEGLQLNTGSPHLVRFISSEDDLRKMNVSAEGAALRYSGPFREQGINVNFVHQRPDGNLFMRTYERGVEDETWSCGTGVTAASITSHYMQALPDGPAEIQVETPGGNLRVSFDQDKHHYRNVLLCGPAVRVFEGDIELKF